MSPIHRFLDGMEEYVIGVSLFLMLAIVFLNAMSRYLINLDLAFALEIVTSLFPWVTFLGGAVAVKRKGHVAFSLLMQIRNQLIDAYTEIRNMRI